MSRRATLVTLTHAVIAGHSASEDALLPAQDESSTTVAGSTESRRLS